MEEKKKSIYGLLIKLQLTKELMGAGLSSKKDKVRSLSATVVVYLLLAVILAAAFSVTFAGIAAALLGAGLGWAYMGFMAVMIIILCFFMSVFLVHSQLFESKDNEMLLSMPIKPRAILVSRVIGLLIMSYGSAALVALPALIIYLQNGNLPPLGYVFFVIEFIVLPMLATALSILIGWVVGTAVSKSRHKKLVQSVLTILGVIAYMVFYMNINTGMNGFIGSAITSPVSLRQSLPVISQFGSAIADGDPKSMLITLGICVIPFVLACLLVSFNFSKILTGNKGTKKIEYKAGRMTSSGKRTSIMKMEFSRLFSSPSYLMNGAIGLIFMIAMPIMVIFQLKLSDEEGLDELSGLDIGAFLGKQTITPAIVTIIMLFMMTFVIIAASTTSLDAKTLWVIKSSPVPGKDVILGKAAPHVLLSIPFVIASSIIIEIFLKMDMISYALMLLAMLMGSISNGLLDVLIGVKLPKTDWLTETEAVKRGKAPILAMTLNLVFPATFILLFVLLRKVGAFNSIPFLIFMVVTYIVFITAFYTIIKRNGERLVSELRI